MHLRAARRLGLVGLLSAALALPATAAVASTSPVDTPDGPSAHGRQYLGSAPSTRITRADEDVPVGPVITHMAFTSSATYGPEGAYVEGRVLSTGEIARAKTEVRVNGVYKGLAEIYHNPNRGKEFIIFRSGWGAGKVVLGPTYITQDPEEEPTQSSEKQTRKSGTFRVRYGIHPDAYYTIDRSGNKVSIKAVRFTMFKLHKYVSMGRVIVQVRVSDGWKDKKVLALAGNGNSVTYTFKSSAKHYYRLKVTETDVRKGVNSEAAYL